MLTGFLGDSLSLPYIVEDDKGPVDLSLYVVKATLVDVLGKTAMTPTVTCSPGTDGADHVNGKAVGLWSVGTYPLLVVGQVQLEVSLTKAGVSVTWPRMPVQLLQRLGS